MQLGIGLWPPCSSSRLPKFTTGCHDNDNNDNHANDDGEDEGNRSRMDGTFALTNVLPQVPRFNCRIWLWLEKFVCWEAGMTTMGGGGDAAAANEDNNRAR